VSRYNHYGEEREGYGACENRRSHEGYPYEADYSFQKGWTAAERDERWEEDRREDRRREEYEEYARSRQAQEEYYEEQFPEPQYQEPEYPEEE
jgi:hypothetical protein